MRTPAVFPRVVVLLLSRARADASGVTGGDASVASRGIVVRSSVDNEAVTDLYRRLGMAIGLDHRAGERWRSTAAEAPLRHLEPLARRQFRV